MADVKPLIDGLQALLQARTTVVQAAADDVPRLLAGHRLRRLDARLADAAAQARQGARLVAGASTPAADAARHAAELLEDARLLTSSRTTWNASRTALAQVRDSIDTAIVEVRAHSSDTGAADDELVAMLVERARGNDPIPATEWDQLAELASLPDGVRSTRLQHMTDRDVAALRDQASRIREGLDARVDRDLRGSLRAASLAGELADRAATEQKLERLADMVFSVRNREVVGDLGELLADIDALGRLDPSLRPRGIERLDDVDLLAASEMAGRGTRLPERWAGWPALRTVSESHQPQEALTRLVEQSIADFRPTHWRQLASLVSVRGAARPDALAGFSERHARDMRFIAQRLEHGRGIPAGWDGLGPLATLRSDVLWPDRAHADSRMVAILSRGAPDIGTRELYDLDALRRLPDATRPAALDPHVDAWARAATAGGTAADHPEALDALATLRRDVLSNPRLAHEALDRIDDHVRELAAVEARFSGQGGVPRPILRAFDADLQTLRAFELSVVEADVLENAQELVRRNVRRLDREITDTYPGHVDYADLGRIRASIELLGTLVRTRLPIEPVAEAADDAARVATEAADDAPGVATRAADDVSEVATEAAEQLSW